MRTAFPHSVILKIKMKIQKHINIKNMETTNSRACLAFDSISTNMNNYESLRSEFEVYGETWVFIAFCLFN